jgi:predicted alpha/beta superfamily hydrolase
MNSLPRYQMSGFWQQLWFEGLRRMAQFQPPKMSLNRDDSVLTRFGTLHRYHEFPSAYVAPRNVDVWVPPENESTHPLRLPVIYMHDGQNLFDPHTAFAGVDWGIDEAMCDLIGARRISPAIGVAIWNTPQRSSEYMPQRALERSPSWLARRRLRLADRYLNFLVRELKPFIDERYRTLPSRENTFMMGSSMGALISVYAVCEYPSHFGGAACISTHWPAAGGVTVDYLKEALPESGRHKFYFDYGTATVDALYQPY